MLTIGSLCSGYGGLDLAVEEVFGAETVWHADLEEAPAKVLAAHWPGVPNLGDLTRIDWHNVRPVDIFTAGYPCQPDSDAGKRLSQDDPRWIFPDIARGIGVLRPRVVVLENVRGHFVRGFRTVLGTLTNLGYDAQWTLVRASDVGAPHRRTRLIVVATDAAGGRRDGWPQASVGRAVGGTALTGRGRITAADPDRAGSQGREPAAGRHLSDGRTTADAQGVGRDEGRPEPARVVGGSDAAQRGASIADARGVRRVGGQEVERDRGRATVGREAGDHAGHPGRRVAADADGHRFDGNAELDGPTDAGLDSEHRGHADGRPHGTDWGTYTSAIERWERVLGRPAPAPTELAPRGGQRLSPRFVEWMMGLPAGWVTDVPSISRNDQLKALGNGVVPQQAAAAIRALITASAAA